MGKKKTGSNRVEANVVEANVVEANVVEANVGDKIILSDEELGALKARQQEMVVLKVDLANFVLQIQKAENTAKSMAFSILEKENEYLEEAKKIAKSHGVDADSPDSGKWNLNIDEKTLNKV